MEPPPSEQMDLRISKVNPTEKELIIHIHLRRNRKGRASEEKQKGRIIYSPYRGCRNLKALLIGHLC